MKKIDIAVRCLGIMLLTAGLTAAPPAGKEGPDRDLNRAIERNSARHLEFLRALSRTTREGEEAVQALVAKRMRDLKCEVETLRISPADLELKHEFADLGDRPPEPRISVVGRRAGRAGGRSLLLFAHPDNPPQEGLDRWRHDPFGAVIEGGRLYGWGVADDLAGVAIMIEALAALGEAGLEPGGEVILCSTPAKRNAQGVIALLSRGYTADAAVYLHPAESGVGMKEIKAVASGMLQFRIRIAGRAPDTSEPGHTAFAHRADNPAAKGMMVARALEEMDARRGRRVFHPGLDAAVGRSTNLLIGYVQAGEKGSLTRVPETCTLGASLTFPPSEKLADVRREVEAAVAEAARSDPWLRESPPRIDWVFGTQGVETPVDHPLYLTVSRAIRDVIGEDPFVNPLHSASDIRNPILYSGIPTVGLGPLAGDLAQNGLTDEWVDTADYIRAVQITARILLDWGNTPSR